jgi:hypothetical protein
LSGTQQGQLSGYLPAGLLGQQSVYLAFRFFSDDNLVTLPGGGAYVDDVLLTAEVAGGGDPPPPTVTPTVTPTATRVPGGRRNTIYLPLGVRRGAAATPPDGECQERIANGGFTQAAGAAPASWSLAGNVNFVTGAEVGHATPNLVNFAYIAADGKGPTGDLTQTVAGPANPTSATLSFWYNLLAGASTPMKLQVDVLDQSGATVLLPVTTVTQGKSEWQQVSVNLSAAQLAPLAGKGIVLRIRAAEIDGPLDLFFDDLSWRVCG